MANLNQLFAEKRASIDHPQVEHRVRREIRAIFKQDYPDLDRIYFPSSQIPARQAPTIVVLSPEHRVSNKASTVQGLESVSRSTITNVMIWCVPDSGKRLYEEARKFLAWREIREEAGSLKLDETQFRQINVNVGQSRVDLRDAVWRTYSTVLMPRKDGSSRSLDLGLVHSSVAATLVGYTVRRLIRDGNLPDEVSRKLQALAK